MRAARVAVRVTPGARRTEIAGRHGDTWKVRIVPSPEGGRANEALVRLFAAALGVRRTQVTLVKGASARDKVIEIEGLTTDEADSRLAARWRKGEK
jgi:uncharacterized protein (TIGR00251 family)